MTRDGSRILERLYRVLVEEIRDRSPEYLETSFTVAEIYQNLVPYRSHRDRIGVEMNADYEDALLRLLAGEGDYLSIDSEAARRQIREELDSLNPDTGVYRDFAAVDVHLNPEKLPERKAPEREPPEREEAPAPEGSSEPPGTPGEDDEAASAVFSFVDAQEGAGPPRENGPEGPESGPDDPGPDPEVREPPSRVEGDARESGVCPWCRGELPEREELHFCPHCGSRPDHAPCPECGTELDAEWRFCIACGAAVGES